MAKVKSINDYYPELMTEWNWEKNNGLFDPRELGTASNKKVWWKCKKCNNTWNASISSRTYGGNGCPYCSGKAIAKGFNDLATTNPELASEWNYEKNLGLLPSSFSAGSQKKVWWKCNVCSTEWEAIIGSRKKGNGCPVCGKRNVIKKRKKTMLRDGTNTLLALNPELLSEFDLEKNDFTPNDVTPNTNKKAWWKCKKCGCSYYSSIANRHKNGAGCPACSNQKLYVGINDLETLYPEIAKEFSIKNGISPKNVLAGGHKKYIFNCSRCGNEWKARMINRVRGNGCPKCTFSQHTSIPEQVIFKSLKARFDDAENSYRPEWLNGKEIDIYLPSIKLGIEYDGSGWHQDLSRDELKTKNVIEHGISLIRIRETKCPEINDSSVKIEIKNSEIDSILKTINDVFAFIRSEYGLNISDVNDIDDLYFATIKEMRNKESNNSFAINFPKLLKEWDYEKNNGIDPYKINSGSGIEAWWKCAECGYKWTAPIQRRTAGAGCPHCAHEVVWEGHNDVETLRPDLLADWDFAKNVILPNQVQPQSHRLIYWKCSVCGHEWRSPLYNKSGGHGCSKCARKEVAFKQSKRVMNLDTGVVYESAIQASKVTGISHSCITRVCRGDGKTAGGFKWKYCDK